MTTAAVQSKTFFWNNQPNTVVKAWTPSWNLHTKLIEVVKEGPRKGYLYETAFRNKIGELVLDLFSFNRMWFLQSNNPVNPPSEKLMDFHADYIYKAQQQVFNQFISTQRSTQPSLRPSTATSTSGKATVVQSTAAAPKPTQPSALSAPQVHVSATAPGTSTMVSATASMPQAPTTFMPAPKTPSMMSVTASMPQATTTFMTPPAPKTPSMMSVTASMHQATPPPLKPLAPIPATTSSFSIATIPRSVILFDTIYYSKTHHQNATGKLGITPVQIHDAKGTFRLVFGPATNPSAKKYIVFEDCQAEMIVRDTGGKIIGVKPQILDNLLAKYAKEMDDSMSPTFFYLN